MMTVGLPPLVNTAAGTMESKGSGSGIYLGSTRYANISKIWISPVNTSEELSNEKARWPTRRRVATTFFVLCGRKPACGKSLNVRYHIRRRVWALTTSREHW